MARETVGPYELLDELGAGGMGVVFRARDARLKRLVALKLLPASVRGDRVARARLLREAQAASGLDHPGIATVYDVGEHEGALYVAMQYVEGETLRERLGRGRLAPAEAEGVLVQVLEALAAAHARGVVHRDLKPANVMVTPAGQVKLLDFGLAKLASPGEEGEARTELTETGTVVGTVAYMSPEQLSGEEVDATRPRASSSTRRGTRSRASSGRIGSRCASPAP